MQLVNVSQVLTPSDLDNPEKRKAMAVVIINSIVQQMNLSCTKRVHVKLSTMAEVHKPAPRPVDDLPTGVFG